LSKNRCASLRRFEPDLLRRTIARGTSMEPTFHAGDYLMIEATHHLRVGDVAVFLEGGRVIGHRVISVASDHIEARGDNQTRPPTAVPIEAIIGRVVEAVSPEGLRRSADSLWARVIARVWVHWPRTMRFFGSAVYKCLRVRRKVSHLLSEG
jgi:signal peptidase I